MANIGSNKLGNNGGRFYDFLNRPVLIDCNFVVDSTNGNGLGIRSLKGAGVQNVFMHTTASPGIGANGQLNPNPAPGYALIQLMNNYNRYAGGFSGFVSPLSGSNLAINAAALTVGNPYVIVSVGHGTAGTETITAVADVSGSLASTWFRLYDSYGNTFVLWFSVSGVGSAPVGVSGSLIQVSIHTNDTASTVASQLVLVIENLLAAQPGNLQAPAGIMSFTASAVGAVVTVVSTQSNPVQPLPGVAADGAIPTGFTFALVDFTSNLQDWQQVGLPPGVVPAVGASFIATKTGYSTGGGSTGLVQAPSVSGVNSIEVIGDPNQSLGPIPMGGSPNVGGWLLVQMLADNVVAAPANNSVCGMSFHVEAGSILIQGE
jgi:hypothetical protein